MSRRFRQWVNEYQDQAWTLARYLLKDPMEAEDVLQEAFVKLWHNHKNIDPAKTKAWLMKVVRNACLDRLRKRRTVDGIPMDEQEAVSPGPMEDATSTELGHWLKKAINRLNEPYRSLVVLRDIQQHSYDEVAGVLELSLAQVKVYLHRARKQLREQLAEVRP